jgi:hypothetical protein
LGEENACFNGWQSLVDLLRDEASEQSVVVTPVIMSDDLPEPVHSEPAMSKPVSEPEETFLRQPETSEPVTSMVGPPQSFTPSVGRVPVNYSPAGTITHTPLLLTPMKTPDLFLSCNSPGCGSSARLRKMRDEVMQQTFELSPLDFVDFEAPLEAEMNVLLVEGESTSDFWHRSIQKSIDKRISEERCDKIRQLNSPIDIKRSQSSDDEEETNGSRKRRASETQGLSAKQMCCVGVQTCMDEFNSNQAAFKTNQVDESERCLDRGDSLNRANLMVYPSGFYSNADSVLPFFYPRKLPDGQMLPSTANERSAPFAHQIPLDVPMMTMRNVARSRSFRTGLAKRAAPSEHCNEE